MNVMLIRKILLLSTFLGLVACSGDPIDTTNVETDTDDTTTSTDEIDLGSTTHVTYLPLMTIDQFKDWSGFTEDNILLGYYRHPWIYHYTINTLDSRTGLPVTGASASDFNILIDDIPVNPKVSFPLLQPIVGNQIVLRTAIVINTSSAMDAVDQQAFIDEIIDYVELAKDSSTSYIANQEFTVWGYSGHAVEETGGATAVEADIIAAINAVDAKWTSGAYEAGVGGSVSGGANHTYDAVVEAIGRYAGDGEYKISAGPVVYRDSVTGESNDLMEFVTPDFISGTSVILFSGGYGSPNRFGSELVQDALDSQAGKIYEATVTPAGADTEAKEASKPFIYVIPDGEQEDVLLGGKASSIVRDNFDGAAYNFAGNVLTAQINAIETRFALGNQHVLRWASPVREGDKHEQKVTTRTPVDELGFTITNDEHGIDGIDGQAMPEPQVEITGANNEYIATNIVTQTIIDTRTAGDYDTATTYANLISRFYPATRWTNQTFTDANYTWIDTPDGSVIENADGSVSISPSATFPFTLELQNNNIEHNGATITDNFILTVQETN